MKIACILFLMIASITVAANVPAEGARNIVKILETEFTSEVKKATRSDLIINISETGDELIARNFLSSIALGGGYLNQPEIDADTLTLIICHEIGHTLGGAPFLGSRSIEGQSDYYATSKCLPRVWGRDNVSVLWNSSSEKNAALAKCEGEFSTAQQVQLCMRILSASKKLTEFLSRLEKTGAPSFLRTEQFVQKRGFYHSDYPSNQCRLDTMLAGALCTIDLHAPVDVFKVSNSACMTGPGARPTCWFQPELHRE